MTGALWLLAAGAVLYWSAMVIYIARALLRPPRRTYASAIARGLPGDPSELPTPLEARRWTFGWRGLDLPVWDIDCAEAGPVIIMTHGWASSRLGALRRIPHLAPLAGRIIAWDLPGHGEAPGRSALGAREAGALRALIADLRRQGERRPIVLYGSSLGAGVSIAAAAAEPAPKVALVIAEAPYCLAATPARAVLRARGVPPLGRLGPAMALAALASGTDPLWRGFDRARQASRLRCTLVVIHGGQDEICPLADGEAIARAAARGKLVVIEGAGHNDLWSPPHIEETARAVREALGQLQSRRSASDTACGAW